VFWEVMLLPMYFLIGVWGGPRREYAAIKFFIYTLLGSVFMLVVILVCYFKTGSFSIPELIALQPFASSRFWVQTLAFFALFVAFAIKVPIFPFHTWLPDAHVEAPTSISVILAGILLKMGGYGFLRINWPLLKDVATAPHIIYFMIVLALISIIYGALCAMAQSDFKKLVAYSSVSHMGYVLLGIAVLQTEAVNGAIFQMFAHGLSSAMLFLLVGVIYERAHHREIARFGGLGLKMPVYLTLSIVGFFASLGLPGLVGFIGEVMVFLGAFRAADGAYRIQTLIATLGILLTAAYILWTMQRVYLGKLKPEYENFSDVNKVELVTLVPLALLCILFGVLPNLLLSVFSTFTDTWLALLGR
ncbi:MAG: NADH-quinone oxidoreductase subunit M, partial [bacterium]